MLENITLNPTLEHKASVIWLHGLGADGSDFAGLVPALSLPEELGIKFIFPHAPVRPVTVNQGMPMRAWFDIYDFDFPRFREDRAGVEASSREITTFIEQEQKRGIPDEKIILAGFSQGGAVVLYNALTSNIKLGGVLALSTFLISQNTEHNHPFTEANQSTPIAQMHGHHDPIIPHTVAQHSFNTIKSLGYDINWQEYSMAHEVCSPQIKDIREWLQRVLG